MDMDYDGLLTLATDLGYGLLVSGAEIYRVEDSMKRLMFAYGIDRVESFVIPNCINISILTPQGKTLTQIRRMPSHGNDVDMLARYNDLCRRLCREVPPLSEARERLDHITATPRRYSLPVMLLAHYVASAAFAIFFGGDLWDAFCSGWCGIAICLSNEVLSHTETNPYFDTMIGAIVSAFLAQILVHVGLGHQSQYIIIGAFMALVPGILFTNALRDVMVRDMVSGITKVGDALFIGVMAALGTALALGLAGLLGV